MRDLLAGQGDLTGRAWRRLEEGEEVDIALLEHVSPIEWDNVIFYGRTSWTEPRSDRTTKYYYLLLYM